MRAQTLHGIWSHLRARARRRDDVAICRKWSRFDEFHRWALDSGYQLGRVLARVRSDRSYSPSNCTWTSQSQRTQEGVHGIRDAR